MADPEVSYDRPHYYILVGREPMAVTIEEYVAWCPKDDDMTKWERQRRVGEWFSDDGEVRVTTVFLGIDHALQGPLQVFETMIFGGEFDGHQWRYPTWDDAEKGHAIMVKNVQG